MRELRHRSFFDGSKLLAALSAENARDTGEALSQLVPGYFWKVERYAATAGTTQKLPIPQKTKTPMGVLAVRVHPTGNPSDALLLSTAVNFSYDGSTIYVIEPPGLTLNTFYDFTFLVLG